ncbi:hypothetical protein BMETH_569_2 [methanotrophic bacterial endosymbiont of Bathymodiolus sp.]|nr:hypothetical protein BMETH_569_2 [methanotrophic bacterial endosymbiont of Bathymodiolus sp.]
MAGSVSFCLIKNGDRITSITAHFYLFHFLMIMKLSGAYFTPQMLVIHHDQTTIH